MKLLPLLLFETSWKLLWLSLVALPKALSGTMGTATSDVAVSCSLIVFVIAVIPWRHIWGSYVRGAGHRWR